jgi:hypothetical protein
MKNNLTEHVQSLRERLAEIEHEQWIAWSKDIAKTEGISEERFIRWQKLWRPYNELTEVEKDQDREWGDKAFLSQLKTIELLKEELEGRMSELEKYPFSQNCPRMKEQGWCESCAEITGRLSELKRAITLLDTIIQEVKSQMK